MWQKKKEMDRMEQLKHMAVAGGRINNALENYNIEMKSYKTQTKKLY